MNSKEETFKTFVPVTSKNSASELEGGGGGRANSYRGRFILLELSLWVLIFRPHFNTV